MADEPSLGELGRLIQALRGDIRDDMAQINARLDRMVSTDVYTVEKAGLVKEIADLAKDVEGLAAQRSQDAERVTQTRRWMVASVIIPLIGIVLPLIMMLRGAGA
ncbi:MULTISPECIES: hypothetical protein [unclassified Streptomyces]|uniref:hypothetical protein n=1 Tax=unclassified Streptomyces TaxID=2593676 RepID=UPI00088F8EF3|nr:MULTISPECIES: hypothetical protein [unclassified Streptomyces]SDR62030.1 hypothetical protein SAMN05216511_7253 [Streptomyces sp. KS_16]SEE49695.1 hypothetical protein SAMN05428940_7302 [Streptomyces sp. 2133.1]SNC77869.1 hypothetical protein SAMN06272741_7286 [Streptomyces sp. 2114.4]